MIEGYFEFASEHSWLGFWLGFWALFFGTIVITTIVTLPFRFWNRFLRSRNIKNRGWPPLHLDANGNWKKPSEVKS